MDVLDELDQVIAQIDVFHPDFVRMCKRAKAEIDRLRAYKFDVEEAARVAAEEDCGGERHCTCVPLLRSTVKKQQAEIERLRAALQGIAEMAAGDIANDPGYGSNIWQIEADARAALHQ